MRPPWSRTAHIPQVAGPRAGRVRRGDDGLRGRRIARAPQHRDRARDGALAVRRARGTQPPAPATPRSRCSWRWSHIACSQTTDARSALRGRHRRRDADAAARPDRRDRPRARRRRAPPGDRLPAAGQVKLYAFRTRSSRGSPPCPRVSDGAGRRGRDQPQRPLLALGVSAGRVALWSLASPRLPRARNTTRGNQRGSRAQLQSRWRGPGRRGRRRQRPALVAERSSSARPRHRSSWRLEGSALDAVSYNHTGNTLSAVGAHAPW